MFDSCKAKISLVGLHRVQIGANWFKLVQIGANWCILVQIGATFVSQLKISVACRLLSLLHFAESNEFLKIEEGRAREYVKM